MNKILSLLYIVHYENMGITNILTSMLDKKTADKFRKSMETIDEEFKRIAEINEVDDDNQRN